MLQSHMTATTTDLYVCAVDPIWQLQVPHVWSDNLEQTSTGFAKHSTKEQFRAVLSAGYSSVLTAGGASVRR